MIKISALITLAVLTTACTTFDAYTGDKKTTNTAKGAGIGAGIAAVIAYVDNKDADSTTRRQRILKAAAGGAAIGGGIGYYMDNQEAKLRQQLRGSGVSVQREGDNINLILPSNVTFASNSSDVSSGFYDVLNSVALVIKEFDQTLVVVAGHTDSSGDASYNQSLSVKRAASVSNYLRNQGVIPERLETTGFGESQPVASNNTPEGKAQNRRVEITLLPVVEQ